MDICGTTKYCAWSNWSTWGECSKTCGIGTQLRERTLTLSSVKPELDNDILVTSILSEVYTSFKTGNSLLQLSIEHVLIIFTCGMISSMALLGIVYNILLKRRIQIPMDTEFTSLSS